MPLHTHENGRHKQISNQVLERMWRTGNPTALSLGVQTGAATLSDFQ